MNVDNCIFCKIAKGEIPSATLYEDNDFRVILDVSPASKGHALILPKKHFADIYEMPKDLMSKAFGLAKQIGEKLSEVLKCQGLNILQNNGTPAGQTVFHFHIHLIPRYENDGIGLTWKSGSLSENDRQEILTKFKV